MLGFFLMALILAHVFSGQAQTEMVEEWWSERRHCHKCFPQYVLSSHVLSSLKYKCDIVFSFFLSLDENLKVH